MIEELDPAAAVLAQLVERVNDDEGDDYWELISDLTDVHGLERMRDWAAGWCDAENLQVGLGVDADQERRASWVADAQGVGLDVLGTACSDDATAATLVLEHASRLRSSPYPDVRWSAAAALGHVDYDPERQATRFLIELLNDPDADVRAAAVQGLSVPTHEEPEDGDPQVVAALCAAMSDQVAEVRDWATFALGVNRDVDTPQIRSLFLRALDGNNQSDEPAEAAVALARRQDSRVVPSLLRNLERADAGNLWVEAAGEIADPRCLPLLVRLRDGGLFDDPADVEVLDIAIERCGGQGSGSV